MNNRVILIILLLVAPVFLVFRALFLPGPAVWGDAPYFPPEAFKNFFLEPFAWQSRGSLGVVTDLYWIYPFMFVYRLLGFLGLSNDWIIRIVFYFPALFFVILSPWLFARYLGFSRLVCFFCSIVYVLNTYFILLVDGGQVGVALAYALFPLALLGLRRLRENGRSLQFFASLGVFMALVAADARLAMIAFFCFIVWVGFEHALRFRRGVLKGWRMLAIFMVTVLVVSAYLLVPTLKLESTTGATSRENVQLVSVLHPLFLFSPHWPLNEFGRVGPPSWFFFGLPFLIFGSVFFKKDRRILIFTLLFLFFVFLVKGESGLFSGFYAWVVGNIPLGGAFQDSTKFFAPLLLFAGVLVGVSVEELKGYTKNVTLLRISVTPAVFVYLLFLVFPVLFGGLNGVLAGRDFPSGLKELSQKISSEEGFFRTLWFPEPHPLAFHTESKLAFSAKKLVDYRPFASLNVGILDRFNFLNRGREAVDLFRLLGIRYLFFPQDARKVVFDEDYEESRARLLELVGSNQELSKLDWDLGFPAYEVEGGAPRVFSVDRLIVVVGSDDVYRKVYEAVPGFSLQNQAFAFLEDGVFSAEYLNSVDEGSVRLVFNESQEIDLTMSYLQDYFVFPVEAVMGLDGPSQWAIRSSGDYLKWKYEFLVNGVDSKDFDYGGGVAFSTIENEMIYFDVDVPKDGEYVLAVRSMAADNSNPLEILAFSPTDIPYLRDGKFEWYIREGFSLQRGKKRIAFKNGYGLHALNALALIPKDRFDEAKLKSEKLVNRFGTVRLGGSEKDSELLRDLFNSQFGMVEIEYSQESPVKYLVTPDIGARWIVFTDSYNPGWRLLEGVGSSSPFPAYSTVNGFYFGGASSAYVDSFTPVPSPEDKVGGFTAEIVFEGQKYVVWGMVISALSAVIIIFVGLGVYIRSRLNG